MVTNPQVLAVYLRMERPFEAEGRIPRAEAERLWGMMPKAAGRSLDDAGKARFSAWGDSWEKGGIRGSTLYDLLAGQGADGDKAAVNRALAGAGYDGIKYDGGTLIGTMGSHQAFVVFDPRHIKSATGNAGTYSILDADLRKSLTAARAETMELLRKGQLALFPGMALMPSRKNPTVNRWQQTFDVPAAPPPAETVPGPSPAAAAAPDAMSALTARLARMSPDEFKAFVTDRKSPVRVTSGGMKYSLEHGMRTTLASVPLMDYQGFNAAIPALHQKLITAHPVAQSVGAQAFDMPSKLSDAKHEEAVRAAMAWRYLTTKEAARLHGDKVGALRYMRETTRDVLDKWLMERYGVDAVDARSISNEAVERGGFIVNGNEVYWRQDRPPTRDAERMPEPTHSDFPGVPLAVPATARLVVSERSR